MLDPIGSAQVDVAHGGDVAPREREGDVGHLEGPGGCRG